MQGVTAAKIQIAGLGKTYRSREGEVVALEGVDLAVDTGEFVTIVGPSGCGKSTLLYILAGFLPPNTGTVRVDGQPVRGPGVDRGIVFQEYALFPWLTVFQNLTYGLEMTGVPRGEREETARRYVKLIGLEGFERRFPRELSGGMKQRVAIARTLAYDPDILLLDEPFGALDAQTRELMQDELLRIWEATGKTVVMITHDVSEAVYLSRRVAVMSRRPGRIVREFPVDLDKSQGRERTVLSQRYTDLRNEVWLTVREEVLKAA
ncbi:MAG: ABC transporter ATP-binding protein [Candidatus Rokubacteria bacterium]|nr:ABC transporter ATP-binding protein [Candidatus Rokubacteria bacterium]